MNCVVQGASSFPVAESRRSFHFLQHENLLRADVVIRATNNRNLQCNIVARQVTKKMLPVQLKLGLYGRQIRCRSDSYHPVSSSSSFAFSFSSSSFSSSSSSSDCCSLA